MSKEHRPGKQTGRSQPKVKKPRRWILYTFLFGLTMIMAAAAVAGTFVYNAYKSLPVFEDFDPSLTSFIKDNQGNIVYVLAAEENRTLIKNLDLIPIEVQQAFIATEDRRFKEHFGIDPIRLGGAIISDIQYLLGVEGAQLEGGSTITMQLAGNAFLDRRNVTPLRKIQEMLLAIQLERRFTKDEILLRYLNQVSFGLQSSGLEAAAQTYFSKSAKDLTVSEAAMFAGMLKAPSYYNPVDNYEGAMERREIVLQLMAQEGYLDMEEAEHLKVEQPKLRLSKMTPTTVTFTGDWYVDHAIQLLITDAGQKFGIPPFEARDLYSKGLHIYTALDVNYQRIAQEKLTEIMPKATAEFGGKEAEVPEGAVVIMNHQTGEVKALVGGMEHDQMLGHNRATMSYRQPGSAIKPLVAYLPAIDLLGWGPATVVDDSPVMLNQKLNDLWPKNYELYYRGLLPLRTGLEQSINTMAVRALQAVGPKRALNDYARKMGLSTLVDATMNPNQNDENLALALGGLTHGVTPLEMTAAYGVLGSMGMKVDPVVITKIVNQHGEVIYDARPRKEQVIKNKESVWLMVDIMKGSILRGTARYESKGFNGWPAAGKTGTTEDWHDAWFLGFTSEIVTGVWTGYDNEQERKELPGAGTGYAWTGAGPPTRIWTAIMNEIVKERPADWVRPAEVVRVEICRTSGLLPSPLCPQEDLTADWFRRGFVPRITDNVWVQAKVVKKPWLNPKTNQPTERYVLWQDGCLGTPEELLFIRRPFEYAKHPTDPWNYARYWPRDWTKELPTAKCDPLEKPPPGSKPWPPSETEPPDGLLPPPDNITPPWETPPPDETEPPVKKPPEEKPPSGGLLPIPPPSIRPPGT